MLIIAITIVIIVLVTVIVVIFSIQQTKSDETKAGMIGLWPSYGGGLKNQQTAPYPQDITLNQHNIENMSMNCVYESEGGTKWMGYVTIDEYNNSYFTDSSGYITCINLNNCQQCWPRQHVSTLLGFDENVTIITHQSLTIFQDSAGNQGLLFGAPSFRDMDLSPVLPLENSCYALAIHLNNGTFWWKLDLSTTSTNKNGQSFRCTTHGFYVDSHYAYGGLSQGCCYQRGDNDNYNFIGRFIKIDIDKHQIENVWFPLHYNLTDTLGEYNLSYSGMSSYGYPAIDDDYVVFGTANAWTTPLNIQQCMLDNYTIDSIINDSVSMDICGNNQTFNPYFRCLSNSIFPSSLIILNKNTFELKYGFQLSGLDAYRTHSCQIHPNNAMKSCGGYYFNQTIIGFNADLTAVSIYKNKQNNKKYVIAVNKASRIFSFELETGKLHFTKQYAPQTCSGQFNIAIDQENMIGITTMNGAVEGAIPGFFPYVLANGLRVCKDTAVVLAFDLNNGKILWQIINPYGTINETICFNGTYSQLALEYIQRIQSITCEKLDDNEPENDNILVHIPPKSNVSMTPINSKQRAKFRGGITVIKDMVFIPSDTGDIFVHNIVNGSFIHRFICPAKFVNGTYNRPAIKGGVSIVNDRIVVYCGGYWVGPDELLNGNHFVSWKLNL